MQGGGAGHHALTGSGPSGSVNNTTMMSSTMGGDGRAFVDKSTHGPSKILTRKWREMDLNIHRQKLSDMKAIV